LTNSRGAGEGYITLEGLARVQYSSVYKEMRNRLQGTSFEELGELYKADMGDLPHKISESYEFSDGEMADEALVRKSFAVGYLLGLITTHETSRPIYLRRFSRMQTSEHRLSYVNTAPMLYFGNKSVLRDLSRNILLARKEATERQRFTVEHTAGLALLGYEESRYDEYAKAEMATFRRELKDMDRRACANFRFRRRFVLQSIGRGNLSEFLRMSGNLRWLRV
jgi:hypothetical protein